mgnify:FL=1
MVTISNADRDKAVSLLRAYADSLTEAARSSAMAANRRRLARLLAARLEKRIQANPRGHLPQERGEDHDC